MKSSSRPRSRSASDSVSLCLSCDFVMTARYSAGGAADKHWLYGSSHGTREVQVNAS